ncbi:MAG: RidA family protein [Acidobacteria bacterium]|nr:RidA family protein [Acidobacteriota bacterium]
MKRQPHHLAFFVGVLLVATGSTEAQDLKTEFLGSQQGFSHIAKTTAGGVTTILVSGQIGWADGAEAPAATLSEQAEIAFANVVKRLEQAGATAEDLVKTTVFIKDIDPDKVHQVGRAQAKVLQLDPPRAATWVGVTGLVYPSLLIEVEATAVLAAE